MLTKNQIKKNLKKLLKQKSKKAIEKLILTGIDKLNKLLKW